jgi:predicted transcriptional regulator
MENKETIKDRLNLLISSLGISKNQFAKEIGTSSAMISKITTQDINFGVDIIEKIISTFPRVNNVWLLTGVGKMFNENVPSDTPSETPFHTPLVEKNEGLSSKNLETDYLIIKANELITDLENRISFLRKEQQLMSNNVEDLVDFVENSESMTNFDVRSQLLESSIDELVLEKEELKNKLKKGDLKYIRAKLYTKNKKNTYNERTQIIGNQSVSEISATQLDEMIKDKLSYMDFFLIGILYHVRTTIEKKKGNPFNDTWYDKQRAYIRQFEGDVFSKKPASYTKMNIKEKFELIKELDEAIRGLLNMIWDMSVQIYSENAI